MAEELRITVVDEGGELPAARAPTARPPVPGAGTARPPAMRPTGTAGELSATSAAAVRGVTAIGITAAAAATAFAGAVAATRAYTKAVEGQVQLLSRFSAEVQAAQIESTFARQSALLRRGERIGGDLARAEQTRQRFEIALIDLNTELLAGMLKVGTILEAFTIASTNGIKNVTDIAGKQEFQTAFLVGLFGPLAPQAETVLRLLEKGLNKYIAIASQAEQKELADMLGALLAQREPGVKTGFSLPGAGLIGDIVTPIDGASFPLQYTGFLGGGPGGIGGSR